MLALFVRELRHGLAAEEAQNVKAGLQIPRWGTLATARTWRGGKNEYVTLLKRPKKYFLLQCSQSKLHVQRRFQGADLHRPGIRSVIPSKSNDTPLPPKTG